jgi:hypothetical protein
MARIGQHTEPPSAIGEDKLNRLASIVGNREGMDPNIADGKGFMAVDDRHAHIGGDLPASGQRPVGRHDSPAESPRTGKNSPDVVGVLMRDKDGIDITGGQAQPFESARNFARPETGIDQHTGIPGFDQQGVAAAAAAERGEAHPGCPAPAYFNCS